MHGRGESTSGTRCRLLGTSIPILKSMPLSLHILLTAEKYLTKCSWFVLFFSPLSSTVPELPFSTLLSLLLKCYCTFFYTLDSTFHLVLLHHRCWMWNICKGTPLRLVLLVLLLILFLKFQILSCLVMTCKFIPNFFLNCL